MGTFSKCTCPGFTSGMRRRFVRAEKARQVILMAPKVRPLTSRDLPRSWPDNRAPQTILPWYEPHAPAAEGTLTAEPWHACRCVPFSGDVSALPTSLIRSVFPELDRGWGLSGKGPTSIQTLLRADLQGAFVPTSPLLWEEAGPSQRLGLASGGRAVLVGGVWPPS